MTALTVDPAIFGITDYYAQMQDCEKDDLICFDTPNIYKEDEGAAKCNTNDPQTETDTWSWNATETIISVTMDSETTSYNVITNDGTTLKVSYTENIQGTNYVMTATLVKQ